MVKEKQSAHALRQLEDGPSPRKRGAGPLNLRQLEVFHAIMITGSLSAAGRMLFVSQPAISRTLASCETRLGYPLFDRVAGKVVPTPEAKRLLVATDAIYTKLSGFNNLASELGRASNDFVRIASNSGPGIYLVPQAMMAVREDHEARFSFAPMNTDLIINHLLLGRADLGISLYPVEHPNLTAVEIGHANMVCIARRGSRLPEGGPLTPGQALDVDMPLIGYFPDTLLWKTIAAYFSQGDRIVTPQIEVSSPVDACEMVRQGVGMAFVDSTCITPSLLREVIVRSLTPSVPLKVLALRSKTESLSIAGRAFLRCFRSALESHQHGPAVPGKHRVK